MNRGLFVPSLRELFRYYCEISFAFARFVRDINACNPSTVLRCLLILTPLSDWRNECQGCLSRKSFCRDASEVPRTGSLSFRSIEFLWVFVSRLFFGG